MESKKLSKHTKTRLIWRDGKKVRASRWIMEQMLGRKLLKSEQVHHKNKNPLDNRIENLQVLECKRHMKLHKQIYSDLKQCALCGRPFLVNPRKRKRNKCCSKECAQQMRTDGVSYSNFLRSVSKSSRELLRKNLGSWSVCTGTKKETEVKK